MFHENILLVVNSIVELAHMFINRSVIEMLTYSGYTKL